MGFYAAFRYRESYGASSLWHVTSYGAVRRRDIIHPTLRLGTVPAGRFFRRCGANTRRENRPALLFLYGAQQYSMMSRTKPRLRTVLKPFLRVLAKPPFLYGAPDQRTNPEDRGFKRFLTLLHEPC